MGVIKVPTTFNIDVEFEIPEFYRRLFALLIDIIILFFYSKIAIQILSSIHEENDFDMWGISELIFLPVLIYHVVLEITMNGQSFGKRIMSIRVVNENGGRASVSQFLIRWFLRDIWFFILLLIGMQSGMRGAASVFIVLSVIAFFITDIVLVAASKKGQRIGDLLAHTILIKTNARASIEDTVFQEVSDTYTPSFPQIMQLSDKDINAIKSILEAARKKGDFNMADAASNKIKAHLKIDSQMSPFDFLEMLLKDYNYLSTK